MLKLILADDDSIVLHGLSMIISSQDDFEVLGTAKNGQETIKLCREYKPDVALLDIRMPVMDGIDAAKVLIEEELTSPLLLTTFDEPELIDRALDIGARGYILKNSPVERIVSAIRTVAEGGTVFAPDIVEHIKNMKSVNKTEFFKELTQRENEIVELVAQGLSNQQIADKLFLSNGTVRNYISVILEKTELEHRTQIAVKYYAGE